MSHNNEGVANPGGDQNDRQDVHEQVISGVVANLISDRESRGRQHEMGQDFHTPFSEHEVGDDDAYETYDSNEIINSLHQARPILSVTCNYLLAVPLTTLLQKREATANPPRA
jgi:hypothetical protein